MTTKRLFQFVALLLLFLASAKTASAFTTLVLISENNNAARALYGTPPASSPINIAPFPPPEQHQEAPVSVLGVVAPLEYHSDLPYPCLSLRFPNLPNKDANSTTVLTFIVDTGANVNSVPRKWAHEHHLRQVQVPIPGLVTAGVGGNLTTPASSIVMLGDCQLEGLPPEQRSAVFLRNLTAASMNAQQSLPLLGMPFVLSFPGGVEFDWYGTDGDPPTMIFYYQNGTLPEMANTQDMVSLPLRTLSSDLALLAVTLVVNNSQTGCAVQIPALLDTGSPITVFNQRAAQLAGLETMPTTTPTTTTPGGLLGRMLGGHALTSSSAKKPSPYGDPVIAVGGIDGHAVYLQRSQATNITIHIGGNGDESAKTVSLRQGPIYVGRLPGLALLESALAEDTTTTSTSVSDTNEDSPALALLGLDFLLRAYRMIVRPHQRELWVQPLTDAQLQKLKAQQQK